MHIQIAFRTESLLPENVILRDLWHMCPIIKPVERNTSLKHHCSHFMICCRPIVLHVATPGHTGHRIEVEPGCSIAELRGIIKDKTGVDSVCQLLAYNGQVLSDEHPKNKEVMNVKDYVIKQGNWFRFNLWHYFASKSVKSCEYCLETVQDVFMALAGTYNMRSLMQPNFYSLLFVPHSGFNCNVLMLLTLLAEVCRNAQ